MTTKPRFVLDTNLVVSSVLIKQSFSRRAFDEAEQDGQLLLADKLLQRGVSFAMVFSHRFSGET